MFEKVGLKDVLYKSLKYCWIFIVIFALVIGGYIISEKGIRKNDFKSSDSYCSQNSYFFLPDMTSEYYEVPADGGDTFAISKRTATMVGTYIKTDTASKYVINNLLIDFDIDFLAKYFLGSSQSIKEFELSPDDIDNFVFAEVIDNTNILDVRIETGDQLLSNSMLKIYDKYINEVITTSHKDMKITVLDSLEMKLTAGEEINKPNTSISKKTLFILAVGLLGLYAISIIIISFVFPTINFRSEFDKLGITVIGDI